MKQPVVYMMANQRNGTLYIGVTSKSVQRTREKRIKGGARPKSLS